MGTATSAGAGETWRIGGLGNGDYPVLGVPRRVPPGRLLPHGPGAQPRGDRAGRLGGRGPREDAEGRVDAAIVDVPLADEGACEFVKDLHEADPSVPVLVMTHLEDEAFHEKLLEVGASEVLSKEISFAEVLDAVRRLGNAQP